jgi:uncharacterized membrane-anchored protein YhcB (DUF1043 family)
MQYDEVKDKEYLQKELVPNVQYLINDDIVKVNSDNTNYCYINRPKEFIHGFDIMRLYKDVIKLAKQKNISISYKNKYKKIIEENYEQYTISYNQIQTLFKQIAEDFKEVQKRGIHYGTMDDYALSEAEDKRNKYGEFFYRNTAYSIINDIYRSLKKTLEDIEKSNDECFVSKIFI